jgi:hypothetical protein
MTTPRTAPEVARLIVDVLEAKGLPYAIGGAIALGYYAPPRATVDVDINVFLPPSQGFDRILSALAEAGFVADADVETLRAQACREGQFRGRLDGMRIDVFVPAIDFYGKLAERKREVALLGRPIWILGAEDLVVLKLMFYRRKDLADVEALMAEQGTSLDRVYVHRTLTDLVGPDDERLAALRAIEQDVDCSR